MLQFVDGRQVYVVILHAMPDLPIVWDAPSQEPYAKALTAAIQDGVITEPGKYGIQIHNDADKKYDIYAIKE